MFAVVPSAEQWWTKWRKARPGIHMSVVCMCMYGGMLNILQSGLGLGPCKNHQKKNLNVMLFKLWLKFVAMLQKSVFEVFDWNPTHVTQMSNFEMSCLAVQAASSWLFFFEKSMLSVVIIVVIKFLVFIIKCHCQMHLEVLASGRLQTCFSTSNTGEAKKQWRKCRGGTGNIKEVLWNRWINKYEVARTSDESWVTVSLDGPLQSRRLWGKWLPTGGVPRSHLIPNS